MPTRHVTKEEWEQARAKEKPDEIHPCDHPFASSCMCEGACSCHWKEADNVGKGETVTDKEDAKIEKRVREFLLKVRDHPSLSVYHIETAALIRLLDKARRERDTEKNLREGAETEARKLRIENRELKVENGRLMQETNKEFGRGYNEGLYDGMYK